ncbi:TdcF Putative translation initiation inhibitor, yjgF family [Paracoccaceae bacterium]|jgi:enamine deaminase RidA (YjgF/YER057c/UK114 family)
MSAEAKLKELGINLPEVPGPIGNFVPGVLHNGLLYMSGEGPLIDLQTSATGVVGQDVSVEEAYQHARLTGLAMLSSVRRLLGSLDRVERILSVHGMVNAVPDFKQHPKVMNGFSDLMVQLFGENGRHARAAVGMGSLPDGITVEVTAIFAVKP